MASIAQVSQQLNHFLNASSAPIVDLRQADQFALGHISASANFPEDTLFDRLHELPQKSQPLRLVAEPQLLSLLNEKLTSKGFLIEAKLEWSEMLASELRSRELLAFGESYCRLWEPAAIIETFVAQFAKNASGKRALDLGCGSGRDSVYLALNGWQVTAVDYLQAAIGNLAQLAQNHRVSVKGLQLDLEQQNDPLGQLPGPFDLILVIRYLHRPLLTQIRDKIAEGGFIVYQTFMQGCEKFGKPKNPRFLLKPGELANVFTGFEVLVDKIEYLDDGRPTNVFIARKSK